VISKTLDLVGAGKGRTVVLAPAVLQPNALGDTVIVEIDIARRTSGSRT
jgi:hypothetical protein